MTRAINLTEIDELELVKFQEPIFNTIQGEGTLMGTPSTFIRLQGCNQACSWCDTKSSWVKGSGEYWPMAAVLAQLEKVGCLDHVVITGGNPMNQSAALKALLASAFFRGKHITIETNAYSSQGTADGEHVPLAMPHHEGMLWSLSPKIHAYQPGVLRRYLKGRGLSKERVQVKIVVTSIEDMEHAAGIFALLVGHGLMAFTAIIQPEFSVQRKLSKDPSFMETIARMGVPVRVMTQAHKSLALL